MNTINDLVFVGRDSHVLALNRATGEIVWEQDNLYSGYTTVLLDGDRLIVSTNGYLYCFDGCSGRLLWHNPLKGYGTGSTSLASARGGSTEDEVMAAEDHRRRSD